MKFLCDGNATNFSGFFPIMKKNFPSGVQNEKCMEMLSGNTTKWVFWRSLIMHNFLTCFDSFYFTPTYWFFSQNLLLVITPSIKNQKGTVIPKQVGSPTKARAGFLKIGLPLNWVAAVGFTKWGTVIFSDLVSKGRLARLDWQDQIGKVRLPS